MIVDLQRFIDAERPCWTELERMLDESENQRARRMNLEELQRFHYLYRRASADLAKVTTMAAPEIKRYLESLVSRAYGEIHETREKGGRLNIRAWLFETFPQTFRRNLPAFWVSLAVTLAGAGFGGAAISLDPEAKAVIMPFPHLLGDPAERVAREEGADRDRLQGAKGSFSTTLMTHNTRVSILTLALGTTWGIGTMVLLFYNGVILGAVVLDYVLAGQARFLAGWLLPHGAIEIPAILIAGQAGFVLAGALIGWDDRATLRTRLRAISTDLITLIFGVALFLVWAGLVEAFFSQFHEPVIPYAIKIVFGVTELGLLICYLARSGALKPPATLPELK